MSVYKELEDERKYQRERWGDSVDLLINTPNDFVSYISHYSTKWLSGEFTPYSKETVDNFRIQMIKTAAIAIAAVEALDKQRTLNGSTHYEEQ